MEDLQPIEAVPHYGERLDELRARLAAGPVALFLDFDGVLAPIVEDPDRAAAPDATLDVVARLATAMPVAVVSGRGLDDVASRVPIDDITVAGSHGLEVRHASGEREDRAAEHRETLDAAENRLRAAVAELEGVSIERKAGAVVVHVRQAGDDASAHAARVARGTADEHRLVAQDGKQIVELRPDVDWHKGRVVETVLDSLPGHVGLYLGDDVTDEDAFEELARRGGVALVVRGETDHRPTHADYAADDPEDVRRFLEQLAALAGV